MKDSKTLSPIPLDLETFKKLQKIIAKLADERAHFVSVREAIVDLIETRYVEISGSIRW